ncbi:MAG: aldehyde dehydrogenase family protein [Myxococcota bacterium]
MVERSLKLVSGGDAAGGGEAIECHDPATGAHLGSVPVTPPSWLPSIVARGRDAQRVWRAASFRERGRVLSLLRERILERADELCETVVRDAGKTWEHAVMGELWPVVEKLRWTVAHGERHLSPERVSPGPFVHKRARIEYEPLGVVGVIAPWNYPLQNFLGPTVPALMAGNAVVIKPSEWVAWSSARIQALLDEVLEEAGAPRGLVQTVQGHGRTGAALIGAGIDLVVFTGSHDNGKRVLASAAETLTPAILELGGKDPLIVCDDADLERAAHAVMAGTFINCGQNCLATERILVFDAVYDDFAARVCGLTASLRQGPPVAPGAVDVGAILSPLQLDRIEELVDDAVRSGARVLCGGRRVRGPAGQFFEPTILADVTPAMRIAREETFGPVMLLMRVRGEREAIRVANGTPFGLSATVATRSARRARRMARQLVAGSTSWNDFGLTYMAMDLPFGGTKGSGFGRLNGRDGLRAFTNVKSVMEDRFPFGFPAKVFPAGTRDYATARNALRLIYGRGVRARLAALRAFVRDLR